MSNYANNSKIKPIKAMEFSKLLLEVQWLYLATNSARHTYNCIPLVTEYWLVPQRDIASIYFYGVHQVKYSTGNSVIYKAWRDLMHFCNGLAFWDFFFFFQFEIYT